MKQRRSYIVLLAVVLLFGAFVFSASAKGAADAPVFQSPLGGQDPKGPEISDLIGEIEHPGIATAGEARVGREFITQLWFTVGGIGNPGMTAAEVFVAYDPTLVIPVKMPGVTGNAEVLPDFFGVSQVFYNEILAPTCTVQLASGGGVTLDNRPCLHLVVGGPEQFLKKGIAARLHWTGLATGTPACSVLQPVTSRPPVSEPHTAFKDADGRFILLQRASCEFPPIDQSQCRLLGKVTRQGVPAYPNPGGGTFACTKVLVDGTLTTYSDQNGSFTLDHVTIGSHTVQANYNGYLPSQKTFQCNPGDKQVDVGETRLWGGDAIIAPYPADLKINILDIGRIISFFTRTDQRVGSAAPGACVQNFLSDESADVNDDGLVNIGDLAIGAGNWGKVGPLPWSPQ